MRRISVIWLSIMLTFSSAFLFIDVSEDTEGKAVNHDGIEYVPHAPIRINSNADFDEAHGVDNWATGSGTEGNPWIIDGWVINGTGYGCCLYIGNTTNYFVVKDCFLYNASGNFEIYYRNSGIYLYNAQNGRIESNNASLNNGTNSNGFGIYLDSNSDNNIITNNTAWNNFRSIYLYYSDGNTITYNTVSNSDPDNWNQAGIYLQESSYNIISNNTADSNNRYGIRLTYSCNGNTIANNILLNNYIWGIRLRESNSNTIVNNIASNNSISIESDSDNNIITGNSVSNYTVGIYIYDSDSNIIANNTIFSITWCGLRLDLGTCDSNVIYHNNFINNADHAFDDSGTNFWDNGYPSGGNYWDDHGGVDIFSGPNQDIPGSDGIGDTPYTNIDGGVGAQDNYPLMNPTIDGRVQRGPIRINSNADFDEAHGVVNWATGDGSAGNSWIIENYDINGAGFGYCIYIGNTTDYFVVKDCYLHEASGNSGTYYRNAGIYLYNTQNGKIENNTVSLNNLYSFYLDFSDGNTIANNTVSNNGRDLHLRYSSSNTIANNTVSNNNYGIYLWYSSSNNIINNTMVDDGIFIFGDQLQHWNTHTIDTSNTVSGKPIYYWKNQVGGTVPLGAGEIILANCANVVVEIQNISNSCCGIELGFSSSITIVNNTVSSIDWYGIYLAYSNGNIISNNNASSNNHYGILLYSSSGNTVTNNTASNSNIVGIRLSNSNGNTIANNTMSSNNACNIVLSFSTSNLVYHNNFITNTNQAEDNTGPNFLDNGYPSGGNYWSDYSGIDQYSGLNQDIPGSDGIGDTPYTNIMGGSGAQDNYPLMSPFEYTEYDVPLQEGWNLISLPVRQLNWSIDSVLESIQGKWDYIMTYDETTSSWKSNNIYRPASLNDLTEMNHLKAYWINITEPGVILIVKGDKFNSTLSMPLKTGWNFVGYPSLMEKSISDALAGTGYDRPVEGFNASAPYRISQLADTYIMKPGEGYWVHVPADTVWVVDW